MNTVFQTLKLEVFVIFKKMPTVNPFFQLNKYYWFKNHLFKKSWVNRWQFLFLNAILDFLYFPVQYLVGL